jgi:hypothetical protein
MTQKQMAAKQGPERGGHYESNDGSTTHFGRPEQGDRLCGLPLLRNRQSNRLRPLLPVCSICRSRHQRLDTGLRLPILGRFPTNRPTQPFRRISTVVLPNAAAPGLRRTIIAVEAGSSPSGCQQAIGNRSPLRCLFRIYKTYTLPLRFPRFCAMDSSLLRGAICLTMPLCVRRFSLTVNNQSGL